MPRPRKCRKVCRLPEAAEFAPVRKGKLCDCKNQISSRSLPPVVMSVDEFETIRLIDREGFSQEECGKYMNVARTTIQHIYNSARGKIAHSLVDGRPLKIEGGDYQLCDGKEDRCGCGGCKRHRQKYEGKEHLDL